MVPSLRCSGRTTRPTGQRPWDPPPEPTRFPIARLSYTKTTAKWAIYWSDRNLKFHEYLCKQPSKNVHALFDYIRESQDPIFFG